ncbi:MAG: hypothetical protein K2I10_01990 [Lachnospiraceae bacterium]|nr:hypothetical protein [Lachnospiraceae bacterium]
MSLRNPVSFKDLKIKHSIGQYTFVRGCIAYNDEVYFLFSEHVPERIQGMFVDTQANTRYIAVHGIVDWINEELVYDECLDFGVHEMNYHHIQPVGENILLLGARSRLQKNGMYEKNACIVNRQGEILRAFCLGDGIENCIVTKDERIITSYFDEGVFGDAPFGNKGLVVWDCMGHRIWENKKYGIMDCYAINVDEYENLWFYYYTEFDLVQTDFKRDIVYHPEIKGMTKFLITKGRQLLCDGGYNNYGEFYKMDILYDRLGDRESVNLEHNGKILLLKDAFFRSSKAIFVDNRENIYFKDIMYIN